MLAAFLINYIMENKFFALIIAIVLLVITWAVFYLPRYTKKANSYMEAGMGYYSASNTAHNNLILWNVVSWIAGISVASIFWNLFVTN